MDGGDPSALGGSWLHSFEEDEGDVQTYRPAQGYAFPPSRRGRESLEFGAAGQARVGGPAPDDRMQSSSVELTPLGDNRYRLGGQVVEIVEATPQRLKLRRL